MRTASTNGPPIEVHLKKPANIATEALCFVYYFLHSVHRLFRDIALRLFRRSNETFESIIRRSFRACPHRATAVLIADMEFEFSNWPEIQSKLVPNPRVTDFSLGGTFLNVAAKLAQILRGFGRYLESLGLIEHL